MMIQGGVHQLVTFLTQVVSMRVMLLYMSLFMASSLLASCLSLRNSSSRELRQFMVSERESIIDREELLICVISFFSSFIFSICLAISWRSRSRCSWSSFLRCACRLRSSSSCSSFWTLRMRLSILTRRWDISEQILLTRLLKQVAVLSQTPLKNMTASKSSVKSWTFPPPSSSRWRILTMASFCAPLISSARLMTSSLMSMSPRTFLPILLTLVWYWLMISAQMVSILVLLRLVISSMKSRMASLALSERMLRICLLLTQLQALIERMIERSESVGWNFLLRSSLRGDLKRTIRFWSMRYFRNFCSSCSNIHPRSFFSSSIFRISRWQSITDRSRSARFIIITTPSFMSSNVLKLFSRFFVSLGSLSALASLMCDSSIISTTFTFGQMSSSLCTKNEFDISYSSPLLSLNPGQSQNARLSITSLLGIDVQEYFSCPIFTEALGQSRIGFSPSYRTIISSPARKVRIVDLPTPVSPITIIASLQAASFGIRLIPSFIISFIFSKFRGLSIQTI